MLLKQLFRDSFWYAIGLLGAAGIELARVPIIGRLLGPVEFGHFALAQGIAALSATVATAWLTTSIVRFLPEDDAKGSAGQGNRQVVRLAVFATGFTLIGGTLILWTGDHWLDPTLRALGIPTLLLAASVGADRVFLSVLRARRQTSHYAIYSITQSGTGLLAGLIWLQAFRGGTYEVLLPMALMTIVVLPIAWRMWVAQKHAPNTAPHPISTPLTWWRYGLPLLGVNVLTWIMSYSDRYVLQWTGHSEEVGTYAAVHYLSERSIFLLTYLIGIGVAPIVFAAWERREEAQVAAFFSRLLGLVILAGMPVCVLLAYDPVIFLRLVLPLSFAKAFGVMPLIAIGALLLSLGNVLTEIFTLKKRTLLLLSCYLLSAGVKLLIAWFWVPPYGIYACAWGTVIGYLVFMLATINLSRPLLKVAWPWATIAHSTGAGTVMLVVAHLVYPGESASIWNTVGWAATTLLAYSVSLWGTGNFNSKKGRPSLFA